MKLTVLFIMATVLISSGCHAQENKNTKGGDDTSPPKINVKVNREYDKDGNLIRYDSTYSYSYSNSGNDLLMNDSVFKDFKDHFSQNNFFWSEPDFGHFFFNDSLLMKDFYKNDYFLQHFRDQREAMDSLFIHMDTYKNDYFKKQFRENEQQNLKN